MDLRRILLNLKIARRSLVQFKWRTSLAVLGVFFGTFSLIIVSNLSGSLAIKTEQEIDSLGKDLLIVRSGIVAARGGRNALMSRSDKPDPEDARAIQDAVSSVADLSAAGYKTFPVRYGNTVLKGILVNGVEPEFSGHPEFSRPEGSFVSAQDNLDRNKVAVVGRTIVEKLFGDEDPIGKYILISRVPFQVIGIMEEKGTDVSGADQDSQIFIRCRRSSRPWSTRPMSTTSTSRSPAASSSPRQRPTSKASCASATRSGPAKTTTLPSST